MFVVYDLIFLIFTAICLPVYFFRRKFHSGFITRLGILPENLSLGRPIWIHAVSVGEAIAVKGLVERLRQEFPGKTFVISTVTPTGNKIARGFAKETDLVTYLPLDFSFIVKKVINRINPSLFIIVETEIWPNLIYRLRKNNIPVILVNARISDKSFRGYSMVKFLVERSLANVDLFCAQTESDASRLAFLGAPKDKIKVPGNMKFDFQNAGDSKKDYTGYKNRLGLTPENKFLVAGSTHPGEEEIILSVYRELLNEFPQVRLLIAPRHPERAQEIKRITERYGFGASLISNLTRESRIEDRGSVFILDTVGQLMNYYAISDIVFMGGSLIKKGGHNILEPASLSKPVISGLYVFNFRDIFDLFISRQACIMAGSRDELKNAVRDLLNDKAKMEELGRRASGLIKENRGATEKTLEYIKKIVSLRNDT